MRRSAGDSILYMLFKQYILTLYYYDKYVFVLCACHPCAGAMPIFSVSFQFQRMITEGNPCFVIAAIPLSSDRTGERITVNVYMYQCILSLLLLLLLVVVVVVVLLCFLQTLYS